MSTVPEIVAVHHVTLTVTDLEASLPWYREVLGFETVGRQDTGTLRKAKAVRGTQVVTFVEHADAVTGRFDPRRVGLDHLAFAVTDDALGQWIEHLDAFGVEHSPRTPAATGTMITFTDPDGIALELYTLS